jgi:cytoskeletal protein RodZ
MSPHSNRRRGNAIGGGFARMTAMDDKPKKRWYSVRVSWVVWVVVIIAALLILDLARPFYMGDDPLTPEEQRQRTQESSPVRP